MPLYIAVVASSWIVTRLPLRMAYGLASAAGTLAYLVSFRARRAIRANLSVVLSRPPASPVVRRTALAAFRNNSKNWVDSLRLASTSKSEVERRVHVEGWEIFEQAVREGKGVVLIGMHLGNIDVVGQIIAARGYPITVPVERMKPEKLFRRTQALRQSLGIRTVPADGSGRELVRALRAGQVVGILADRNTASGGIAVEFFGRPAHVSKGPAWLASRGDAAVLVGVGIRGPGGTFEAKVEAVPVERNGDPAALSEVNAQTITRCVEARVREHPEQWCMFANVWNDG
jgi:lauroyl/myristoyl acyltransferase